MKNHRAILISLAIHLFLIGIALGFYFYNKEQNPIIINLEQAHIVQASMIALTPTSRPSEQKQPQQEKPQTPTIKTPPTLLTHQSLPTHSKKSEKKPSTQKAIKEITSKNNLTQNAQLAQQENAITQKILKSLYHQISTAVSQLEVENSLIIEIKATLLPEGRLINIFIDGNNISLQTKRDVSAVLENIHIPEFSKKLTHPIKIKIPIRIEDRWD